MALCHFSHLDKEKPYLSCKIWICHALKVQQCTDNKMENTYLLIAKDNSTYNSIDSLLATRSVSVTIHIVLHCQSIPQYCIQLQGGGTKSPVRYLKREKRERKNKHLSHEIKNFLCTISHRIHYHVASHHGTTHGCWWNSRISFITYATTTTQRWKFLAS